MCSTVDLGSDCFLFFFSLVRGWQLVKYSGVGTAL